VQEDFRRNFLDGGRRRTISRDKRFNWRACRGQGADRLTIDPIGLRENSGHDSHSIMASPQYRGIAFSGLE
jgi:hypothetical protein